MGGRRILSDPQIEVMSELRESGWSYQRIAAHFTAAGTSISSGSIAWQCLRVGADLPPARRGRAYGTRTWGRGRAFTPAEDARLLELEQRGAKYSVIAKDLGRAENSIRGRLMTLARHQARAEAAE
jgi:hypothetical protein